MGKGTIISGGTNGQYQVQLNYDPARKALAIQRLENKITAIDVKIAAETDEVKLGVYKLIKVSYQKKIDAINEHCTEDPTVSAWCADLTEDLTGVVGTIEVPGELGTVNIHPGFDGGAVYATTQGQLGDNYLLPPAGSFYNLAMLPGWQKWKPTFRYATITALDGDIANIEYEVTESSQQGLNINQTDTQDDVEIDYMNCNGAAFEVGDVVLVKFEDQDWQAPKIIGFKDNPKPCGYYLVVKYEDHSIVYDIVNNVPANIFNNDGNIAVFPCLTSSISNFIEGRHDFGSNICAYSNDDEISPDYCYYTSSQDGFLHTYVWDCEDDDGVTVFAVRRWNDDYVRSYIEADMTIYYPTGINLARIETQKGMVTGINNNVSYGPQHLDFETKTITASVSGENISVKRVCSLNLESTFEKHMIGVWEDDTWEGSAVDDWSFTFKSPFSDLSETTVTFTRDLELYVGFTDEKMLAPYQVICINGDERYLYQFTCYSERIYKEYVDNDGYTDEYSIEHSKVIAFIAGNGETPVEDLNPFTAIKNDNLTELMQTTQDLYDYGYWSAYFI